MDEDFEPDIKGWIQIRWDDGPAFLADLDKLEMIHSYVANDLVPRFAGFFK